MKEEKKPSVNIITGTIRHKKLQPIAHRDADHDKKTFNSAQDSSTVCSKNQAQDFSCMLLSR